MTQQKVDMTLPKAERIRRLRALSKKLGPALAVAGLVAVGGVYALRTSAAATFVASSEAENGVNIGNAEKLPNQSGASNNSTIAFQTGNPPPPAGGAKPSAATTGVPAGSQLTVVNGDQTYATDGQVISNVDIKGYVKVTGKNIIIKNAIIRGGVKPCTASSAQNSAPLWVMDTASNVTIQDSEIAPSNATACMDGIWLANGTALRMNIHGAVDGVKMYDNATIKDSYIHDLAYFASDPNQGGGETHNDGLQSYECNKNILVQGNNIDLASTSGANAAYQVTQDNNIKCENMVVTGNWLDGGGCTLNFAPKNLSTLTGLTVTNNKFGRHRGYANCTIKAYTGVTFAAYSGNVWEDTGLPIPTPEK